MKSLLQRLIDGCPGRTPRGTAGSPAAAKMRAADPCDARALVDLFSQRGIARPGGLSAADLAFDRSTAIDPRSGRILEACAGHEASAPWIWTRHLAYLESLRGLSLERCASATLGRDLGSLKALRSLALRGCATSSAEGLLAGILAGTHRFRTILAHLAIKDCGLTGDHLGVLLKGVVPLLPNLETLDLYGNRIGSFRPAAESLDRAAEGHACLHTLLVAGNPIEDWYRFGPTEADALLAILRAFPRLSWVTHLREGGDAQPRVEHALRTNYAGRVLLGAVAEAATAPEEGEEPRGPRPPSVPVSAWPRVLERASMWKRFMDCNDTNVTGIYYLLRCGPALHS